jgi:hypothetical protein
MLPLAQVTGWREARKGKERYCDMIAMEDNDIQVRLWRQGLAMDGQEKKRQRQSGL